MADSDLVGAAAERQRGVLRELRERREGAAGRAAAGEEALRRRREEEERLRALQVERVRQVGTIRRAGAGRRGS